MILENSSSQIFTMNSPSSQTTPVIIPPGQPANVSPSCTTLVSSGICTTNNSNQLHGINSSNGHSFQNSINVASVEEHLMKLEHFLNTAPNTFAPNESVKRFALGNNETIACAYWRGSFFISGTDIVKILTYRFQLIQKIIPNQKKFEEGIFSDLRSLKPGVDSILEDARSEFLEMLYKNGCVRTQKKQKVFFWYSVPHERLFLDALERDRKRENFFNPGSTSSNSFSSIPSSGLQFTNNGNSHTFGTSGTFASSGASTFSQFSNSFHPNNNSVNMNSVGSQQAALGMMMYPQQAGNSYFGGPMQFTSYHNVSSTQNSITGHSGSGLESANGTANSYHQLLHTFGSEPFSKQNELYISNGTIDPLNLVSMQQSNQDEVSIVFDDPSFQELFDNVIENTVQFTSSDLTAI